MGFYTLILLAGLVERVMVRRIGLEGHFIDPAAPDAPLRRVKLSEATPVREVYFAIENYLEPLSKFSFGKYLGNSIIVTVTATAITLLINAMCAFALSKYKFRGRNGIFIFIVSTLIIPITVILVRSRPQPGCSCCGNTC